MKIEIMSVRRTTRLLAECTLRIAAVLFVASSCAARRASQPSGSIPAFMQGEFIDDYGIHYSIDEREWFQQPATRYHIRSWHVAAESLIAQNDSANPGDGDLWTRIDWVRLDPAGEYEWAYCYAVYDASTRAAAEATTVTQRATPRTGCNGFPFSRMKRVER